jgi:tetratricopeptide (TPR) repeat protein
MNFYSSLFACILFFPIILSAQQPEAKSLDGRKLYPMKLSPATQAKYDDLMAKAEQDYEADPNDLNNIIWLGRRTAYLGLYKKAIKIFSKGLKKHPDSPELYRHRGHRYISIRQFDKAIKDFEKAAELAEGRDIEIEPDGLPNKLNIPLSNLQFNIYYHWALAHYLKGAFEKAIPIYEKCMAYSDNDDLITATADWMYMTYRRLGQEEKAQQVLAKIHSDMKIIENDAYYKRLLMYKGEIKPSDLLDLENDDPDELLNLVTQGYGVGNWYFYNGEKGKAQEIFRKIVGTDYWSAFGYIAAEADLFGR